MHNTNIIGICVVNKSEAIVMRIIFFAILAQFFRSISCESW